MSAKIVNLRQARKSRDRSAARREADANAARHGRTKRQRAVEEDRASRAERHVDSHELERE